MSLTLTAPATIPLGQPIAWSFTSPSRVTGRVRLTSGTEAVSFRLQPEGGEPSDPTDGPRVRGKTGSFQILDWGEHAVGSELVLRFEGQKVWMTVAAG